MRKTRNSLTRAVWASIIAVPLFVHAVSVFAAPAPLTPAIGTVVDPERFPRSFMKDGKPIAPFVPVAITGAGFRSDPSTDAVRVLSPDCEWQMHTLTPLERDRCGDSNKLPCVVMWTNERLVIKLVPALSSVALRFAAGGPCVPVEFYRYDWFATNESGEHRGGVPLALAVDAQQRVWLNEEFHRDLKQLSSSSPGVRALPVPPADTPPFGSNLFARDAATHVSMLGEDVDVDPFGRVWFSEGGSSLYGTFHEGNNPNHSRVVMYDPQTEEMRVFNIPGNGNEITGLAFDQRCTDGTSTGPRCMDGRSCPAGQSCASRIWFTENARRTAKFFLDRPPDRCEPLCVPARNHLTRELLPGRLAWFSIEPGATPSTTNSAASFAPGVCVIDTRACVNHSCTQASDCDVACEAGRCADGSGRACGAAGDCGGTCSAGLCTNRICTRDSDCDSACLSGRCTDSTGRTCSATSRTDCGGVCFTSGTCADTQRPCLTNDDCALERQVCGWNDPRRDCYFREYPLPGSASTQLRSGFFHPAHVLVGRDGAIWYTGYGGGNHIGRLVPEACDPARTQVCAPEVFPLPAARGKHPAVQFVGAGPWEIIEAGDGDIVFSEFFDNEISRLHSARLRDPRYDCRTLNASGRNPCISETAIPVGDTSAVQTHSVTQDADGLFWFTQSTDLCFQSDRNAESSIGYLRHTPPEPTQVILFPPLSLYDFISPRGPCQPQTFRAFVGTGIAIDPTTGEIWFSDMLRRRVGRMRRLAE